MQVLLRDLKGSLYPSAEPPPAIWFGPDPGAYATLATSLFSAFVAMLGKQWLNRIIRNKGGAVTGKG